jgi:hypothetical protein
MLLSKVVPHKLLRKDLIAQHSWKDKADE